MFQPNSRICWIGVACIIAVGWCVISDDENAKCLKMVEALKGEGVMDMQCVRGANAQVPSNRVGRLGSYTRGQPSLAMWVL